MSSQRYGPVSPRLPSVLSWLCVRAVSDQAPRGLPGQEGTAPRAGGSAYAEQEPPRAGWRRHSLHHVQGKGTLTHVAHPHWHCNVGHLSHLSHLHWHCNVRHLSHLSHPHCPTYPTHTGTAMWVIYPTCTDATMWILYPHHSTLKKVRIFTCTLHPCCSLLWSSST